MRRSRDAFVISRAVGAAAVAVGSLLVAGCLPAAPPPPIVLLTPTEALGLVNQERASAGVAALNADALLDASAQRWADSLARAGRLSHSGTVGSGIEHVIAGENVGVGGLVEVVHAALMASAPHRANLLDGRFTRIGIGIARAADGRVFVVQQFVG